MCVAAVCALFSDMLHVKLCSTSTSADYDLGKLQSGERLGDVLLPKWAATPEDFIATHREALVSWQRERGSQGKGVVARDVEFEKCMLIVPDLGVSHVMQ